MNQVFSIKFIERFSFPILGITFLLLLISYLGITVNTTPEHLEKTKSEALISPQQSSKAYLTLTKASTFAFPLHLLFAFPKNKILPFFHHHQTRVELRQAVATLQIIAFDVYFPIKKITPTLDEEDSFLLKG